MKTYRIIATVREGIRDNQGIAVQKALAGSSLGFTNVTSVRIGKTYTLSVEDDMDIELLAKKLINEVMENYEIEEIKEALSEEAQDTPGEAQDTREATQDTHA